MPGGGARRNGSAALVAVLVLLAAVASMRRAALALGQSSRRWLLTLTAILAARLFLWVSLPADWRGLALGPGAAWAGWWDAYLLRSPLDALLSSLAAAGVAAALAEAVALWRLRWRTAHRVNLIAAGAAMIAGGAVAATGLFASNALLASAIGRGSLDAVQLSLTPWEFDRLALTAGILIGHVAVVWLAALAMAAVAAPWRAAWNARHGLVAFVVAGVVPAAALPLVVDPAGALARHAIVLSALLATALAWALLRGFSWFRHASYGRQLTWLAAVVVAPTLTLYPALWSAAERAREQEVANTYAMQALKHPEDLQHRLAEALSQIDAQPNLRQLVEATPEPGGEVRPDTAFALWQRTALGESRLTSAIEIYGTAGRLVSRFALNFPEYGVVDEHRDDTGCQWNIFGEAAPFGAEERRMLHAERAVCGAEGREHGTIVVHVMLDYDALPFISNQSPYFEFFKRPAESDRAWRSARGLRLVVYGWGRTPIYTSGPTAWVMDDGLFGLVYRSREPLWTEVAADGTPYKVLLVNDRYGIYAVGYPQVTWFDHAVHVAELTTLALLLFAVFGARRSRSPAGAPERLARVATGPRGADQLFTQAVPGVRRRVDRPGAGPGVRDPRLRGRAPADGHRGRGWPHAPPWPVASPRRCWRRSAAGRRP